MVMKSKSVYEQGGKRAACVLADGVIFGNVDREECKVVIVDLMESAPRLLQIVWVNRGTILFGTELGDEISSSLLEKESGNWL